MIFHLGCDLPVRRPEQERLNHESKDMTSKELGIIREQIRKNSEMIGTYIDRLDLLLNKERYPQQAAFISKIRRRLDLLMEENNTFRKVLWSHFQREEMSRS